MKNLIIYTDGSCLGNPGPGGWAYSIPEFGKYDSDSNPKTTNNEMELNAIYYALQYCFIYKEFSFMNINSITINSDSSYCINSLTNWYKKWVSDGSIDSRPNGKLIKSIIELINLLLKSNIKVTFSKVKGHSGDPENEFVDSLARRSASLAFKGKI